MKVRIFIPAFNVESSLLGLIGEFDDVYRILLGHDHELEVLFINDNSTDRTGDLLAEATQQYRWLSVIQRDQNVGNAANILFGYSWAIQDSDIVGCMDADGEHSPYAMIRHLGMITRGECDGVVGSIIFPDHDANFHDRNMMRFWGGMQAAVSGIEGMFYIQSPGYNLHRQRAASRAIELYPEYEEFFRLHTAESFPRWGMHGVIIYLIAVGAKAHIKAAYLECFGKSPNRSPDKLALQADAANTHLKLLTKFLPNK